ncbi:MAG: N-acetylneuraminate synthase family protein [Thalassospira sp.]|uniref:N-acetylneuraminate synthase family protein n=1 Tax=Thalassospira sp. TaxID=1912094 RepID=UPI0032EE175C
MKNEIIAEIANAHQGSAGIAERMVREFSAAGAQAVKFQIYLAEELLTRSHPRYEHFKRQSFGEDDWAHLIQVAKDLNTKIYCDVFGQKALQIAVKYQADGYKLHASDLGDLSLVEAAANSPGRVLLSAGGAIVRELDKAVNIVLSCGKRPVVLHGFQAYPTCLEDTNLARLDWLINHYGETCDIGFADHLAGDDPFALALPIHALGRGAKLVEKHVTLDRAAKGVDYFSSIEPAEFNTLMKWVRACEMAEGGRADHLSEAELNYRASVKKHWVATKPLSAGHVLQRSDLIMKRVPDAPVDPLREDQLVGKKLVSDVDEEQTVTRQHVKTIVWALPVARSRSSRLPEKALLEIAGVPALGHLFKRLEQCDGVDKVVFCTTFDKSDDGLVHLANSHGVPVYRGATVNVLERMVGAMGDAEVDVVLRVTGDDILVDPDYVRKGLEHHFASNAEYTDLKSLPSGTEIEIFDAELLREILARAEDSEGTEYLTNYVTDNGSHYKTASLPVAAEHCRDWRLTLDTTEDLELISKLLEFMRDIGKPFDYRMNDIVAFFDKYPEAASINAEVRQRSAPVQVNTSINWRKPKGPESL